MGLWEWLTATETRGETTSLERVIWDLIQEQEHSVDPLTIPAVYSSISMISATCAQVNANVWRRDSDGFPEPVQEPPRVAHSPEPGVPFADWVESIAWSLLEYGDAFLLLSDHDRDGHPREATVLDPSDVTITWNTSRTRRIYTWRSRVMTIGFDFAHIPLNRRPGELHGLGPLEAGSEVLKGASITEQFAQDFWRHGAIPTMILNYPHELTAEEAEALKRAFVEGQSTRSPAILSGGMSADEVTGFSPQEGALIDLKAFYTVEISRLFKIPAPLLQASLPSGSNVVYQNGDVLQRQYVQNAVAPILESIEQHMTLLLPRGQFARFDLSTLLRPNTAERYNAHQVGLESGFLTIEEVRKSENLPKLELEDEVLPIVDVQGALS